MSSPAKLYSCVDNVAIMKNPANNSSAKQQWSFPRGNRFSYPKPQTDVFYDVPDTKSKRKAGFGFGKKIDLQFGKDHSLVVPSPGTYNIKSFEEENKIHNKGFFPGYGRDEAKVNSFINLQDKGPGPGRYESNEKR